VTRYWTIACDFLIGSESGGVDFANNAPVVGLALTVGHIEEARQGRQPDVAGGGEFAGQDVFAGSTRAISLVLPSKLCP
jgi:hypothetical protein